MAVTALVAAGCSAGQQADSSLTVATAVPSSEVAEPIRDLQLTPGTRYRFADILPGVLDVELTAPDPPLFNDSRPTQLLLSPAANFFVDGLLVIPPEVIRVPRDPYFSSAGIATVGAAFEVLTVLPEEPGELLPYFGQLPFVEVTVPERPFTLGGVEGRAVDVRIRELPPEAEACGIPYGVARCAHTIITAEGIYFAEPGNVFRFVEVVLPGGALLIQQNLAVPSAQAAVDSLTFVERTAPGQFAPARLVPFGGVLDDDERYVHPGLAGGPAVTFDVAETSLRAVAGPGHLAIQEQQGRTRTLVAPVGDLRVGDPGPDPMFWALWGPLAAEGSQPLPEEGVVDWLAAQPWVEIVEAPAGTTVGGSSGRTVAVRAGAGAPMLPCDDYRDPDSMCVAPLFAGPSGAGVRFGLDEVLRVAEVTVEGQRLAVLTRGDDPTGGTLRFWPVEQ